MDSGALTFALGKTLVAIVAVFLLREKWPHRYAIGFTLCLFAPAWGQIYVESKYNWIPWFIFLSLGNAVAKANATMNNSNYDLVTWLFFGFMSLLVMYFRISKIKKITMQTEGVKS